jgi:hypothetical protein
MDSIFQRTIDKHHLLGTEILVYMDDILIASSSGIAGHRAAVVTFPPHVTSASSGIEKGKWLEWRDAPSRTDSSGSNGPAEPVLVLDAEESFIIGRLVSADEIEHEDDHAPDYGAYGVISGRLALS